MPIPNYQNNQTFCELIKFVIDSEGDFSNNPKDPGGATMYGVSWNYNKRYLREKLGMRVPTDLKRLTLDQAKQLYYDEYWFKSNADGITDLDLAYIHLDTAINSGPGAALSILRSLSVNPKNYDGSGGKNRVLFMTLFQEYVIRKLRRYTHDRNRGEFLEGWANRTADVMENALTKIN